LEHFTLKTWFDLFNAGFARVMQYLTTLNIQFNAKKLKRTLSRVRNKYFALTISKDQQYFTEEILGETFAKMKITLSPKEFLNCVQLYHSVEIQSWKLYPNARKTLEKLSNQYKLALITNASPYVTAEILKIHKINRYFHYVYPNAHKPQPTAFQQFKKALNTPFEALIMVGDDIRADIEPALKLGMKTIHTYRGYEYLKHHANLNIIPHKKIFQFVELIPAVKQLNTPST